MNSMEYWQVMVYHLNLKAPSNHNMKETTIDKLLCSAFIIVITITALDQSLWLLIPLPVMFYIGFIEDETRKSKKYS